MKTVGRRIEQQIEFHASGELLKAGARFNDEANKLAGSRWNGFEKGVYRFKTHEEANAHADAALARSMAALALECANENQS